MKSEQEVNIIVPVICVDDVDAISKAVVWVDPPKAVLLTVGDVGVVVNVKEVVWIEPSLPVIGMDVDAKFEEVLWSNPSASALLLLIRIIEPKMWNKKKRFILTTKIKTHNV